MRQLPAFRSNLLRYPKVPPSPLLIARVAGTAAHVVPTATTATATRNSSSTAHATATTGFLPSFKATRKPWLSTMTTASLSSATSPFATASATTATAANNGVDNKEQGGGGAGNDQNKTRKDAPNLFLDNLGTIFLTVIGLIIASLVRSFYGSTRKNNLRNQLEEASALDPIEVDDLRFANPFISVSVFRSLIADVRAAFPDGQATYRDVVLTVRKALQSKHAIPTIELGYLLDRVALQIAQESGTTTAQVQPVTLWLVLLSLALNAPVPDRIRILYEILESDTTESTSSIGGSGNTTTVTLLKVRDLVSYLQSTSQLVLDTQVLPTENQAYPIQSYHRGSPDELVRWDGGGLHDPIDIDALAAILRSKSVCAWGECYSKQKFV